MLPHFPSYFEYFLSNGQSHISKTVDGKCLERDMQHMVLLDDNQEIVYGKTD